MKSLLPQFSTKKKKKEKFASHRSLWAPAQVRRSLGAGSWRFLSISLLSAAMALCYLMAMGLNNGHKVTKNMSKTRHCQQGGAHQAHQVYAGRDQGAMWLCTLLAAHHGAAQGVQGQAGTQVHQEEGGDTHPCQEEVGGAEQRAGSSEESCSEQGLSWSPLWSLNNDH